MSEGASWLTAIDPRIFQSISSIVTTSMASGTAIFIAVFVYGRQKKLDVHYRLADDIRITCAKMAETCSSIIEDPALVREESALQSVGAKLAKVNYYENLLIMQRAPSELIRAAQELSHSYGKSIKYLYEAYATSEQPINFEKLAKDLFEKRANFVLVAREQSNKMSN
ncbi:MAG: hypothetical protein Q4G25_08840 [Paracoccus sp. (in: a-proteobacteria)]|nr:hypothetical protein [Paracoccus sp. (in: a-proteobacteria)]